MTKIERAFLKFRFGLKVRTSLYKRIAQFLAGKIPLVETMTRIRDRYQKEVSPVESIIMRFKPDYRPRGDFRAQIMSDWLEKMAQGMRPAQAMQDWIPTSEYTLISAGERGRGMAAGLREAATMSLANSRMKKTILANSVQPIVLLGAVVAMLMMFQMKMVPIFVTFKKPELWPSSAHTLYSISYFVQHYLLFVIAVLAALTWIFFVTLPRWKGPRRATIDAIPPWSVYRTQQASAFLLALSSLTAAGVTVYAAMQLLHRNGSPYFRWHLEKMMAMMSRGADNPGAAMNTGLLDKETAGEVEDYSQLGAFKEAIREIGSRNLDESIERIEATMGVLKNIMLIFVAGVVMWIYGTTYMLMATLANGAGGPSSTGASMGPGVR